MKKEKQEHNVTHQANMHQKQATSSETTANNIEANLADNTEASFKPTKEKHVNDTALGELITNMHATEPTKMIGGKKCKKTTTCT